MLYLIDAGMYIWNENNFSCQRLHWDLKAGQYRLIKDNAENLLMLQLPGKSEFALLLGKTGTSYSKDRAKVHLETTHFLIKTCPLL